MAIGRMKIISASSDIVKFGSMSRIGWPFPSESDITGTPSVVTTCWVESFSTSNFSPVQPLASPARRRPTSTSENHAAAKTAVILIKN